MLISHNTFTYLEPTQRWRKILRPFYRCQRRRVSEADCHDIRLRFENGEWWISHGKTKFLKLNTSMDLLSKNTRVLLEHQPEVTSQQYYLLEDYLKSFAGYNFWVGRDKNTWKKLLDFPDLDVIQYVGSMESLFGKIWPWGWWKLKGHKKEEEYKKRSKTENISLDFI